MPHQDRSTLLATIAHPSLPNGKGTAQLQIHKHELHCKFGDQSLVFPLRTLKLSRGGANNKLYFITSPLHPEWSVFTADRSLLAALKDTGDSNVSVQVSLVDNSAAKGWLVLAGFLIVLIALGVGAVYLRNPATKLLASAIPPSWERMLGELVYTGVKSERKIIEDAELTKELTELVAPLTEVVANSGYTLDFHIARDEDLNAFALPGGIIVVNTATILKAPRLDVLLGVLAHEISHVTLQHSTRQIITVFGLYFVVDFIFGNVFGTIAAVSQGATYLLQQGFSRESEREADETGLELLQKARIAPQGMVDFFVLIRDHYANIDAGPLGALDSSLNFLSTHPDTDSRIEYLRERIKDLPKDFRVLDEERFKRFQMKISERQ